MIIRRIESTYFETRYFLFGNGNCPIVIYIITGIFNFKILVFAQFPIIYIQTEFFPYR